MTDTPISAPVNTTVDTTNTILHGAIYDVAEGAARAALAAQFPWTTWPIIRTLVNLILNSFAGSIYTYLSRVSNFLIIDAQTGQEASQLNQAATLLKTSKGLDDAKQKKIDDDFDTALAKLIHFDGSG